MKTILLNITIFVCVMALSGKAQSVFPESVNISWDISYIEDTVIITIDNNTGSPVNELFISDYSNEPIVFISLIIDGEAGENILSENVSGDIFNDRVSTRWLIPQLNEKLTLKYYSNTAVPYFFNWYAFAPVPVYGMVETCCRYKGDFNHSGGELPIDIADITDLVGYLFIHGDPAICEEEADIHFAEGISINIVDLTTLIEYVFQNGSALPLCR